MASMSNVIGYAQVEKIRVLRVALLEAHRRAATTIKAGATWSQIEAEEKQAAVAGQVLTQADELPQTLFRVAARPGSPLLVAVPLKIGP